MTKYKFKINKKFFDKPISRRMGNANIIYNEICLNYQLEELKNCPVYEEHLKTEKYIDNLGKTFERLIYQHPQSVDIPDTPRVSWYQILGQSLKDGGQMMEIKDPFKTCITMTGRGEKLIGQMENEFAIVCNSIILQSIQEIRIYCQSMVRSHHLQFLESYNSLRNIESQAITKDSSDFEYYQIINILAEQRRLVKELHIQLHKDVIYVYDGIMKLKLMIPAMIENQLRYNLYSMEYLEYVLHLFKENKAIGKKIIPLKNCKGDTKAYIPDYRMFFKNQTDPYQTLIRNPPCTDFLDQSLQQSFQQKGKCPCYENFLIDREKCKEFPDIDTKIPTNAPCAHEMSQDKIEQPLTTPKNKRRCGGHCPEKKPVSGEPQGQPTILNATKPPTPAEFENQKPNDQLNTETEQKSIQLVKKQKGCGSKKKNKKTILSQRSETPNVLTDKQQTIVDGDPMTTKDSKTTQKKSKSTTCGKRRKDKNGEKMSFVETATLNGEKFEDGENKRQPKLEQSRSPIDNQKANLEQSGIVKKERGCGSKKKVQQKHEAILFPINKENPDIGASASPAPPALGTENTTDLETKNYTNPERENTRELTTPVKKNKRSACGKWKKVKNSEKAEIDSKASKGKKKNKHISDNIEQTISPDNGTLDPLNPENNKPDDTKSPTKKKGNFGCGKRKKETENKEKKKKQGGKTNDDDKNAVDTDVKKKDGDSLKEGPL